MKQKVLVLGSTGSIGRATLEVIEANEDRFEVVGLACRDNVDLMRAQAARFKPPFVCISAPAGVTETFMGVSRVLSGPEGITEMIAGEVDIVVNAMPGSAGLIPTIESLKRGKILALANKESLVMAGRIVSGFVKKGSALLIPVDSEHSALFQLLKGLKRSEVRSIVLTASGGPFRDYSVSEMEQVRPEEALNHPTWRMGPKVTLDSATLMNKGLEVIEARWLFDVEPERIKVLVHPESIVHGLVELADGSFFSYLASPDMKIPIAYALNGGERHPLPVKDLRLQELGTLSFFKPDMERFPSLRLAYEALLRGDSAMVTMNAANEVAIGAFLAGRIRFTDIPVLIERVLEGDPGIPILTDVENVLEVHRIGVQQTEDLLREEYD
jgi:1-deoxy-D-xylulose-5-phosphate reductoisomerase